MGDVLAADLDPFSDVQTAIDAPVEQTVDIAVEDPSFPEVSLDLLSGTTWDVLEHGPFHHSEGIHILEARAHQLGLRHVADEWYGKRALSLLDNMSGVLAMSRSRWQKYRLLLLVRRCAVSSFGFSGDTLGFPGDILGYFIDFIWPFGRGRGQRLQQR